MKDKQTFLAVLMVALLAPAVASAAPVVGWVAATLAVSTATAAFIVRIGISLVLSSLSSALRKKPGQQRQPGIKTESTTSGGSNPQSFILGTYATAGNMAAPPYSHPNDGDIPNKWLTYVVDISDMPGVQFSRIMVAGEYVTDLEAAEDITHDLRGMLQDDGGYYFRMTWHDGNQTAADAYMLENYSDHPDRPWSADMVGAGVTYAVLTFHYSRKLFNQLPGVRFEVKGIPLYDPRKDDTAGGAGGHRWADRSTWEFTENPIVMVYNILRGLTLPDGQRWGGHVAASNLPLDNWFAGMNECDVSVPLADGGSEVQFRAGLEVLVDDEPAEVIQQLLNACSAEITELGGTYKVRVGPPALPVYFFTDEDVIADRPQSLAPYPGLDGVHNAIHATHPDPESLWESRDAPPRYNAEWEAEDGGRQLVAEVDLPAVASGTQVQRLMKGWIEDERRFRRHSLTLPPDAALLEPLDTVAWTSTREGYSAKLFEVGELTDDLTACLQTLALRERDAGDFTWVPASDEVAVDQPSTAVTVPAPRTLPGFDLLAHSLADGAGAPRRPALRMVWTGAALLADDVVEWEIQLADGTPVAEGRAVSALSGEAVFSAGSLPKTAYRGRGRVRDGNSGIWTGWKTASTDDVRLSYDDLAEQIETEISAGQAAADAAAVEAAAANAAAASVQGEIDALLAGYSGSTLEQSLISLLNSAEAYTDIAETGLQSQIASASANLSANYYTAASTDAAIAAAQLTLQAQIDATEADLAASYYTSAETDNAVSLSEQKLRASIGTGGILATNKGDSGVGEWANASVSNDVPAAAPSGAKSLLLLDVAREIIPRTGSPIGKSFRVRGWVKVNSAGSGIRFIVRSETGAYFGTDDGGIVTPAEAASWAYIDKTFKVTSGTDTTWCPAVDIIDNGSGDSVLIYDLLWEDYDSEAALSGEIASVSATLTQDYMTAASTTAAIAASTTALQADIDGVSATVTTQGAAIADLEGNASAGYLIKAQAGGEVSLLQLVAADGSAGSVSVARLSAKDILLDGTVYASKLAVSSFDNLNPDFDFQDEDLWEDADSFYSTSFEGWGGKRVMRITGPGNTYEFVRGPVFSVSPEGEKIKAIARGERYSGTHNGNGDDMALRLKLSNVEDFSSGTTEVWASPALAWDTGTITKKEGVFTIPPGYRFARIEPYIRPTGATEVRIAGIELRRMNAGELLVDGGVFANHMAANSITAANGAIKDLAVGRLKLAVGSVTELVRLSKTDTTSVAYNAGSRTSSQSDLNTYYVASGTSNMHHVTSAKLSYTVPASDPPEKLLIQPSARMGMTFWDYNTGASRAYNLTAATRVRVDGSDALGYLVPGSNFSFYRSARMSVPLMFEYPDVLLELGTDYAAGDVISFDVFVYRGDNGANFLFGFNMREHTVDILEFYK